MPTITLQGRMPKPYELDVALPLYVDREALLTQWHRAREEGAEPAAMQRVCGALIGRCAPFIGRASKADWNGCGCDPRVYGGVVYSYLREQGMSVEEVGEAARTIVGLIVESLTARPTAEEVSKRAGESTPPPPGSIGSASS